jgi:ABC-type Fe3+/spermidine/putrescine transport system ATPase subunit
MIEVTVQKLSIRFGEALALDDVDLSIGAGELFLLLGASGSGKTTLLRCIAGFTPPHAGAVLFGGEDVTHLAPHKRNAAMVFQSFALFPHLSVAENVAFGLRERRVGKSETGARVKEALETMRIGDYASRRIDQLSGGEQQRVALARALVVRPRCLLLDEPLSNLDAKLRHSMRDEIRRICKEQRLTAIYVTHDQKEALAVADRIAVMKRGRVLQVGTPEEIYRRPTSRSVASFIGETNLFEAIVRRADADMFRVESRMGELAAARPQGFLPRPGDEVWVSVRPECFALGRADRGADATNVLAGAIETTFYTGELAEHRIRCGDELLRAYELNPRRGAWAVGTAANLAVSPDDVILLPFERADA